MCVACVAGVAVLGNAWGLVPWAEWVCRVGWRFRSRSRQWRAFPRCLRGSALSKATVRRSWKSVFGSCEMFKAFLQRPGRSAAAGDKLLCFSSDPYPSAVDVHVPNPWQLLEAASARLQDPVESVRIAATRAVCNLAASHLDAVPPALVHDVAQRLRDTKGAVRQEAAQGLVEVFRAWCVRVAQGECWWA